MIKYSWLFRYPRSEPDCKIWVVSSPDQPHIRSSREATGTKILLAAAGLRRTRPFSTAAFGGHGCPAVRPPGSARTDYVLVDFSSLGISYCGVFITAPSMTTP